jgi:hypothetical protein
VKRLYSTTESSWLTNSAPRRDIMPLLPPYRRLAEVPPRARLPLSTPGVKEADVTGDVMERSHELRPKASVV